MPRRKREARKRQLTELFVQKVQPEARRVLVWDTKQHGLALQVQPTGAKSWKAIYSRQGRPRWLDIGKANAIGLADARKLAAKTMLAVAEGKDPAAEKKAERGAGTFAELAARYVEVAKRKNKSWQQAARFVERYVTPRLGKLPAGSISRADINTMLARIEDTPTLWNQVLAQVSAIFSWAAKQGFVPANPCRGIERNKLRSRERIAAESEVPKLWAAFGDSVQGRALKTILLLGQRPGEVSAMRREHIKDGWWELPGEPVPALGWPGTKNGRTHRVWLSKPVLAITDSNATTGFVFGSRRPVWGLDVVMRDICGKLGMKDDNVTPHDLRRTFSSTVTALGFGRDGMNRVTNHKEGGIANVYDRHQYADENKRIMESVANKIMTLVEGSPTNVVCMPRRPK
jgi:integrase